LGAPVEIGVDPRVLSWSLPAFGPGDRLLLSSASGKTSARTILDEVEILSGASEGTLQPDFAHEGVEVAGGACSVAALVPAVWTVCLEALDAAGGVLRAQTNTVALAASADSGRPVLPLSSLSRHRLHLAWREDFSALGDLFPGEENTAVWENGETLGAWQAFSGADAVRQLTRNHGAKIGAGLYAYWTTNKVRSSYALGTTTSAAAAEIVYGLVFRNDLPVPLCAFSLAFDGLQFGFRNTAPQTLFCEYCLLDRPRPLADATVTWVALPDAAFVTRQDASSGLASGGDFPPVVRVSAADCRVEIPAGAYFHLRWRRPPQTNAAAMAIDNVSLVFEMKAQTLVLFVR
jgi:hypothetical protein